MVESRRCRFRLLDFFNEFYDWPGGRRLASFRHSIVYLLLFINIAPRVHAHRVVDKGFGDES